MTHTSGLPYNINPVPYPANAVDEALQGYTDSTLLFEPGTNYNYSNIGYQLLAAIIEQVSTVSYADYLKTLLRDTMKTS